MTEQEAIEIIQDSQKIPDWVLEARKKAVRLKALVKGKGFAEELIKNIEHIEGLDRAKARKKYARSTKDTFERILRVLDNVYHATGTNRNYDIENKRMKDEIVSISGNIRGGHSIAKWLELNWMQNILMTDPNGVIFLEYSEGKHPQPFYKSIGSIRNYKSNGQELSWILFEPIKERDSAGNIRVFWRFVDNEKDYIFEQRGNVFFTSQDQTFEHPFGKVPALVNSNIEDVESGIKVSPIEPIEELMSEYARDQSIKTIYKFLNGFPIQWRITQQCTTCTGSGKDGTKTCSKCDGHGYYKSKDVTDMVTLPIPQEGDPKIAPDIAGFVSPDLQTWERFNKDLEIMERVAFKTLWGAIVGSEREETATGRFIDVQPVINRLNFFSDLAEFMEREVTDMIANWVNPAKAKNQSIADIKYGRNFIIEPVAMLLERYETAKREGDSNVILDRLFSEYLTAKHSQNPEILDEMLKKSDIEPYVHLNIKEVNEIFGNKQAQKKVAFRDWWETLSQSDKEIPTENLKKMFNKWFEANFIPQTDVSQTSTNVESDE